MLNAIYVMLTSSWGVTRSNTRSNSFCNDDVTPLKSCRVMDRGGEVLVISKRLFQTFKRSYLCSPLVIMECKFPINSKGIGGWGVRVPLWPYPTKRKNIWGEFWRLEKKFPTIAFSKSGSKPILERCFGGWGSPHPPKSGVFIGGLLLSLK